MIPLSLSTEPGAHHDAARKAGAACERCPLANCGAGPVPPTLPDGPIDLLVVGEAPGPIEVERGATLIGPSGREIRAALDDAGYPSDTVAYTNALLCRPPGGDLERFVRDAKRAGNPSPIDCCRPRLVGELRRARFRIFIGSAAIKAAEVGDSILKLRGTPVSDGTALATLHPAFVLRDQGRLLRSVFRYDVAKAIRLARGGNTWHEPPFVVVETAVDLANFLDAVPLGTPIAVDTETDGVDAWTCRIRRIGIGTADGVLIYAPLSVDGHPLVPQREHELCLTTLVRFFSKPHSWFFHNFFGFDSIVLSMHGMIVNEENLFDSLLGHHVGASSELPHNLAFLGSIYTDAPYWKDLTKHEKEDD